jgi:rhamnopyranosyl-N-acetylglucosaminyl-diphospho-decaprenol beta-1,3/1,4-galactofuranosyltransferase
MKARDPWVVAVIVTYNRLPQLRKSLRLTLDESFDHVLVVNNGSTDGTHDYLTHLSASCQKLEVIHQPTNSGGAGGFYSGLSRLQALYQQGVIPHSCWAVLFDDDSYPEAGCIDFFRSTYSTNPSPIAVAAAVLDDLGFVAEVNRPIINIFRDPASLVTQLRFGSCRSIRDLYHVPTHQILNRGNSSQVDAISFVGLFLNLGVLADFGWPLPDRHLFIYGDDTLYTWGLRDCGGKLLFDSNLRFVHESSTGYRDGLIMPIWKLYYITRNSWRVYCALTGFVIGPILFIVSTTSKVWLLVRYPKLSDRGCAFRAIYLAVLDIMLRRRQRSFRSVCLFVRSKC